MAQPVRLPRARHFSPGRLLAAVLLIPAVAGPVRAQELTGVALGPDGAPLADQVVVLHRVGGGGGAFVATDTTNPEGGFRFPLPARDSAVYFAALRYDGSMYIGPAVGAGGEPVSGYVLRVEPGSEAGAVASTLSGQAPVAPMARPAAQTAASGRGSDAGALLLVGLLALAAAGIFLFAAPRYRRLRTREAVIELARLENELAQADVEDRARLEAERDRQRERLAPRS